MYIRHAFLSFLDLQSEAEQPLVDAVATAVIAWPMDHAPPAARRDWTLDWRWFSTEAEQ